MKKRTLYIPCFINGETGEHILVNASKIKELKDYLPVQEALDVHIELQRALIMKDKTYKPQPLVLRIPDEVMEQAMKEIKRRVPGFIRAGDTVTIPLIYQSGNLPIATLKTTSPKK